MAHCWKSMGRWDDGRAQSVSKFIVIWTVADPIIEVRLCSDKRAISELVPIKTWPIHGLGISCGPCERGKDTTHNLCLIFGIIDGVQECIVVFVDKA